MGNKSSKVHQADVEIGQLCTSAEVTPGTGIAQPSVETYMRPENVHVRNPVPVMGTVSTEQSGQPVMNPPVSTLPQQQGMEYVAYSQQHHQARNEDGCCADWKWWHWMLFVLALPFIIAFSLLIPVLYIVCILCGVDVSKVGNN